MDSNNFAEMFEKSLTKLDRFTPGQSITTEIIAITKDTIFLQLSGKSEGILDAAELTDETGKISVTVGDTITAYFFISKKTENSGLQPVYQAKQQIKKCLKMHGETAFP